jgi:xanthine dehydrogenase accessory factor
LDSLGHTKRDLEKNSPYQRDLALSGNAGIKVLIKGGGDLGSGTAWRLHRCGFKVLITEIDQPLAVRRKVAFSEAIYDGEAVVEGVRALHIGDLQDADRSWRQGKIPVLSDPSCLSRNAWLPDVMIDAVMAKRNTGTCVHDAPLVIALGPGFEAGRTATFVVETNRGPRLGRLLDRGTAEADTGVPGAIDGVTDRVLRAPREGQWQSEWDIGDFIGKGGVSGFVEGVPVKAPISGILRGLIRPGVRVGKGLKIGDIDPRQRRELCFTISDKALAIAGGVLEGILRTYGVSKRSAID